MLCPCFGFASKFSFAFCATVWGLRQCNSRFYIILRCVAKQAGQVRLARQWRARAQNESNEYDRHAWQNDETVTVLIPKLAVHSRSQTVVPGMRLKFRFPMEMWATTGRHRRIHGMQRSFG